MWRIFFSNFDAYMISIKISRKKNECHINPTSESSISQMPTVMWHLNHLQIPTSFISFAHCIVNDVRTW